MKTKVTKKKATVVRKNKLSELDVVCSELDTLREHVDSYMETCDSNVLTLSKQIESLKQHVVHLDKLVKDAYTKADEVETRQMSGQFLQKGRWHKVYHENSGIKELTTTNNLPISTKLVEDSVTGYNFNLFKWLGFK